MVSIKRITLYAYDNTVAPECFCVYIVRGRPASARGSFAGDVCMPNGPADPQVAYTTAISPRQVNAAVHGPYLRVNFTSPGMKLYGVKVNYSYRGLTLLLDPSPGPPDCALRPCRRKPGRQASSRPPLGKASSPASHSPARARLRVGKGRPPIGQRR